MSDYEEFLGGMHKCKWYWYGDKLCSGKYKSREGKVTVRIPDKCVDKVLEYSKESGKSPSWIITRLLDETGWVKGEVYWDDGNGCWWCEVKDKGTGKLVMLVSGETEYLAEARADRVINKL